MSTSVVAGSESCIRGAKPSAETVRDRVLVAGFDTPAGRIIANAFADVGARLVLQSAAADDDGVAAAAGRLATRAHALTLHAAPLDGHDDALAATRAVIRALGGIDAAIIVAKLDARDLVEAAATGDIEQLAASSLAGAIAMIRVAANRMGLTWTEGALVVVLAEPAGLTGVFETLASIVKAELATVVRHEAQRLASQGIRVYAVHTLPSGAEHDGHCLPDVGALVTRLARHGDGDLSGLVFEATVQA
jgi:NAD(P)-dependent dehydrogenase (short-subunit alcohol dehydrogenase family)